MNIEQALLNCEKTMANLSRFISISEQINEDYTRAAVIQAFEYTFEVFWMTFQKMGQSQGVVIGSPKAAFSFAIQSGLIHNESVWLALLTDRNLTTHTYHEWVAQQIYDRIKTDYLHKFQMAYERIKDFQLP